MAKIKLSSIGKSFRKSAFAKWVSVRWKWYVLGDYHCGHCPFRRVIWSYEDACDYGCYIKVVPEGDCHLLPPFRFLIGWPKMRYSQYWEDRAFDGIDDWCKQNIKNEEAFSESIKILLNGTEIYRTDADGKIHPLNKDNYFDAFNGGRSQFHEALRHYESHAHPVKKIPLRQQWKDLIRLSWKQLIYEKIAPYLPRK